MENYLEGITDSLLMYKESRFDIKGKAYLRLLDKYYLADIGKAGSAEVDFVVQDCDGNLEYYNVAGDKNDRFFPA